MSGMRSTWNPFDAPRDVTYTLDTFADHDLDATVTMRPHTARQAIAMRDAMMTKMMAKDISGDRTILAGAMDAMFVTSLIVGWDGAWPATVTRELTEAERRAAPRGARVAGEVTEALDLTRIEHLGALGSTEVYAELVRLAYRVQPDPWGAGSRDTTPAIEGIDEDDLDGISDDNIDNAEDGDQEVGPPTPLRRTRSRTPSTPPVVQGEVLTDDAPNAPRARRAPASPTASSAPPRRTQRATR